MKITLKEWLAQNGYATADDALAEYSEMDDCRLLSAYRLRDGTKLWVITEADRSSTTLLLPEEY